MAAVIQRTLPMLSQTLSFSQCDIVSVSISKPPSSVSFSSPPSIYCGRGDKKTAKGNRFKHSFGNARPRDKKKGRGPPKPPMPSSPSKKGPLDGDDDC